MNAFGVASSKWVNTGEKPEPEREQPGEQSRGVLTGFVPDAEMIALTGPVRHVDTAPTSADAIAPRRRQ